MAETVFVIIVINFVLFSGLAAWAVRTALRDDSPRLRTLSWALAAVAVAFVIGSATRLVAVAVTQGWLSGKVGDFLTSEWQLLQSAAALALGLGGLAVVRRVVEPIRTADRIITVLSERLPTGAPISELGLTARELEVLEVIASGTLSDREIAEELYISPSTAGTHVTNIMRKAGCSSRRDLVLLSAGAPE